ncbi:MAG: cell division protein FtsZ, partial [Saprospiraceae bacterium]|nr:cell division protein FtsZ [Saprospiraceae bacterium]
MKFDIPTNQKSIIKVVGVGGGGGNAVGHMFRQGITGVDFAICNTDAQAMENNPVPVRIALGPNLTEGRGAGSMPEVGKQSCIESIEDIRKWLSDGTKMLFITAGMGGGTGTGAAPIIAKVAKEMEILTVAIVTLPFKFEGLRRQRQAHEGLEQLKKNVDSILVISNDKMKMIHGNLALSAAFGQADDILTTAAKGIAEIITVPGYINVDFEDVNTVMRNSGVAIMGSAMADGDDRARKAINLALASPLLEDNDIRGAQHILLNITSGTKEVTMDEIGEITEHVQEEAGYGTDLIWGNCKDESLGEKIMITLIATGFREGGTKRKEVAPEKVKVSLESERVNEIVEEDYTVFDFDTAFAENVVDFDTDDVKKTINMLGVKS